MDIAMIYALRKYQPLGHRELKRNIETSEFLGRTLSDETFNEHLKQMRKEDRVMAQNINKWKRGQKLLLSLTDKTKDEVMLKALKSKNQLRSQRNTQNNHGKRRLAYQLLFYIVAINPFFTPNKVSVTEAFSGYRLGAPFGHLFFSKSIIQECIKLLQKKKAVKVVENQGDVILEIDDDLRNLLVDIWNLFEGPIIGRFMRSWKFLDTIIDGKKVWLTKEERRWYQSIYGQRMTDDLFGKLKKQRADLKRDPERQKVRQQREKARALVEALDATILYYIKQIGIKHSGVIAKHGYLYELLVNHLIYPKFLRSSNREKDETKPKVVFGIARDAIRYTDKARLSLLGP